MRIYLIGYMGSGKTKTAESLAKLLKCIHIDTDVLVETSTHCTIASIFETQGQEFFREKEREALLSTANYQDAVISTGGGTPCYFDNIDWMNANGITVYLEANSGLLFHRLAKSKKGRPLIESMNDVDLMEQINSHLAFRIPIYRKAMITVNAADMDVKALSERIKKFKVQ